MSWAGAESLYREVGIHLNLISTELSHVISWCVVHKIPKSIYCL